MSEDCRTCGTAMWELDEDLNCPGCPHQDSEIDLLTTCGTFSTEDCLSAKDFSKLLDIHNDWEKWITSQIEQEGVEKYKLWYARMNSRCDLHPELQSAHNKLFGEKNEATRD